MNTPMAILSSIKNLPRVVSRQLRAEAGIAVQEFHREKTIRVGAKCAITFVLVILGLWEAAVFIGVLLIVTELIANALARRMDGGDPATLNMWHVYGLTLTIAASTISIVSPSLVLTRQGSLPLFMLGGLWVLGVIFYNSNNFRRMPYFNTGLILGCIVMDFVVFTEAIQTQYGMGNVLHVVLALIMLIIYNAFAFITLSHQHRENEQLAAARTAAHERLAAIEFVARHDELTGLLNRRAFDIECRNMLATAADGARFWVILADLNDFKPINDAYSHDAGDEVLRAIARRLVGAAGPRALISRMGGDEFIVAMDVSTWTDEDPIDFLDRLSRDLRVPIEWSGRQLQVSAALGLVEATSMDQDVSVICAKADQAMYRAKQDPAQVPAVYSPRWRKRPNVVEDRLRILKALSDGEIVPFYQPKVVLSTGDVAGFEALVRWVRPDGSIISPAEFLPLIDDLGLSSDLVAHMARHVRAQVEEWRGKGLPVGDVSINVPESTLATLSGRRDLIDILGLENGGTPLTLEITEDVFFARSSDLIQESIHTLRELGCRISLDDFGTGYASFRHLRELEFDEIKIDRNFTADLGEDRAADVLVQSVLTIAEALELSVTVEGVETDDQRQRLMVMGCTVGQGFLWDRALPAADVEDLFYRKKRIAI